MAQPQAPNVLIVGTPGTGKTSLAQLVARQGQLKAVHVGDVIKEQGLHQGYDEELQSHFVDEDRVVDALEDTMVQGGCVVDYHSCDFFPERWFHLVVVLRTETEKLYDRLTARGYAKNKLDENMECEIMQVVLEEAREAYKADIIRELPSNTVDDLENNARLINEWFTQARG